MRTELIDSPGVTTTRMRMLADGIVDPVPDDIWGLLKENFRLQGLLADSDGDEDDFEEDDEDDDEDEFDDDEDDDEDGTDLPFEEDE